MERKDNLLKIKMMNAVVKSLRLSLLLPQTGCVHWQERCLKPFVDEQQLRVAPTEASFGEVLQKKKIIIKKIHGSSALRNEFSAVFYLNCSVQNIPAS